MPLSRNLPNHWTIGAEMLGGNGMVLGINRNPYSSTLVHCQLSIKSVLGNVDIWWAGLCVCDCVSECVCLPIIHSLAQHICQCA